MRLVVDSEQCLKAIAASGSSKVDGLASIYIFDTQKVQKAVSAQCLSLLMPGAYLA